MRHTISRLLFHPISIWAAMVVAGLVLLFGLANGVSWWYFQHYTYPQARLNNRDISNLNYADLAAQLRTNQDLPQTVTLTYGVEQFSFHPADWGISVDPTQTIDRLQVSGNWLPIANWLLPHSVHPVLRYHQSLTDHLETAAPNFSQDPVDAHLSLQAATFVALPPQNGHQLDIDKSSSVIAEALSQGQSTITVPVTVIPATYKQTDISVTLESLQAQQRTTLTYSYQSKTQTISAEEIASWYSLSGATFSLSVDKLRASLQAIGKQFDISIQNLPQAVTATQSALTHNKPLTFTFTATRKQLTYRYCVAVKDVDASNLVDLKTQLALAYSDPRGWSLGGLITFTLVDSGCNFTVWLAAPNDMVKFSSACDAIWSCTVSPNVIINFDRWRYETDTWTQAGGSLSDYRNMVINHETGHWLGFNHAVCGGPGQLAPVMQQQSIDLMGCTFNPWPLASEQQTLKTRLGL